MLFGIALALGGDVLVDVLDVGQGDAILIRGGGKVVLIDAGDRSADTEDQLRTLGVTRLDLVVATHPHADHIGRMEQVLRRFEVGLFMDNGFPHDTATYSAMIAAVEERQIPYRSGRVGMTLNLGDEAVLTVLSPPDSAFTGTRSDLNSNSVVVMLDHRDVEMLFTGDSEEPTERALVRNGLPKFEVVKVAHHGSAHSSVHSFVEAVVDPALPTFALVSVGDGNRYDHPDHDAMMRWRDAGAMVFRTDKSGQIRIVSDGVTVEAFEGPLSELGVDWPMSLIRAAREAPRSLGGGSGSRRGGTGR
jgi:competence protein ComEC